MPELEDELQRRKRDHLRIIEREDVAHAGGSLLDGVRLLHEALPELALEEIDVSTTFLGKALDAPLLISSMTGGTRRAGELNRALAGAARQFGIALAVGSQRVMLSHPETAGDFAVRPELGEGVLLGNLGAQELRKHTVDEVVGLVERIEADGICLHLNPAHELAQDAGERDFRGVVEAIGRLAKRLRGRVVVKETGAGLSPGALRQLKEAGVTCVDVAGAGGTSWTKVERYRSEDPLAQAVGETFADWGVPAAVSIVAARRELGRGGCVIGSGGICCGLDAARAIALGADLVGMARALLLAWLADGPEGVGNCLTRFIHEFKVALLLTGTPDTGGLWRVPRVYTGKLREWLACLGWLDEQE